MARARTAKKRTRTNTRSPLSHLFSPPGHVSPSPPPPAPPMHGRHRPRRGAIPLLRPAACARAGRGVLSVPEEGGPPHETPQDGPLLLAAPPACLGLHRHKVPRQLVASYDVSRRQGGILPDSRHTLCAMLRRMISQKKERKKKTAIGPAGKRGIDGVEPSHGSFFTEQSWTSGRRNEYKKFEKHLEDCDNIKDGMTIAEVLKLPEVDSFRTSLNKRDRLLCVWMHMTRLQKEEATSQFKAFLIHLLKPNLHLEMRKLSFSVLRDAFLDGYRYLPRQLIINSLMDLFCHIPQHEFDGPQSEDTRKRIKKHIEKLYKKKCHARWFADPTKRFTAPYNYLLNSSIDEELFDR